MKDKLIELLEKLGYSQGKTIFQQGSMGKDEVYPNSFFTFFNIDTPDDGFYDNEPTQAIWSFYLFFYSNDPQKVNTELERATKKLKENGWIIGYVSSSALQNDAYMNVRNILIILAVAVCVFGTTLFFVLRKKKL